MTDIETKKGIIAFDEFVKLVKKTIVCGAITGILLFATLLLFPNIIAETLTGSGAFIFGILLYHNIDKVDTWNCLRAPISAPTKQENPRREPQTFN